MLNYINELQNKSEAEGTQTSTTSRTLWTLAVIVNNHTAQSIVDHQDDIILDTNGIYPTQ